MYLMFIFHFESKLVEIRTPKVLVYLGTIIMFFWEIDS